MSAAGFGGVVLGDAAGAARAGGPDRAILIEVMVIATATAIGSTATGKHLK